MIPSAQNTYKPNKEHGVQNTRKIRNTFRGFLCDTSKKLILHLI